MKTDTRYIGLLDVAGIQRFLFRNSELKSIAAASQQIEAYTNAGGLFVNFPQKDIQVLFAAGGNVAFLADDRELLKAAFGHISRELIKSGTGLEVVASITPYRQGNLAEDYTQAVWELQQRKWTQPRSTEFRFSGLIPYSTDIEREEHRPEVDGLKAPRSFQNVICDGWIGDHIERVDLMAVVSVDGLGMGGKLKAWTDAWAGVEADKREGKDDDAFIAEYQLL